MSSSPLVAAVVFAFFCHLSHGANKSDYYRLHSNLFSGGYYNKEIRPVSNDSLPMVLLLFMSPVSFVEVDEKGQTLTTTAYLDMHWDDSNLAWTPASYGDIQSILVPQMKVWLPDVVLANGVTPQNQLGFNQLPVRITYEGKIEWQLTVVLSTSCGISITYFPFDTQRCDIVFETAISKETELDISVSKDFRLSDFVQDGQWELQKTTAMNIKKKDNKSKIRYTLTLARRRAFYILTIIMPVFFLSLTSSLVFALPPDEGEKMGTGITVLLAFSVYLTIVADLVPNTSLQVSILGVYLTLLLGLTAAAFIGTVIILRIHFRDSSDPVGGKTLCVVRFLRKVTCMNPVGRDERGRNTVSPVCHVEHIIETEDGPGSKRDGSVLGDPSSPSVLLEDRITWQVVAASLDWLCLLVFTTCNLLTTVGCLAALQFGSLDLGDGKTADDYQ